MKTNTFTPIEILSHRGARFEAPENTVAGFEYAVRLGMTTVEFDVRLTKDGGLAVIHDATVDRTTNGAGAVCDYTVAGLRELDARSVHEDWPRPCPVPTLAEIFHVLADMPNMEIEIKKDTPENLEAAVAGVLQAMKDADRAEGIVMTSFEPYALEVAMRLAPDQPRGFIAMDWSQEDPWTHAERFDVAKVGINLQHATPDIVARAQAAGYRTVAWPCNTPEAAALVDACGFDEVCTDNPSLIAPLFGREVREVVSTASRDATRGRYRAVQPGSRP
jgi:glycerophosphoryl diester phosphodiesterase